MGDDRGTTGPRSARPAALGPRPLAQALAAVTRRARRRRTAGTVAVCASACERRARPGGRGGPGPAFAGRLRRGDASPGGAARRERAQEAVESRTTGPDDLACLLDMLDLRRRGD
ncbi:hypothetical protein GCM10010347_21380 [Streptomyces cirratus]|uniref:Uncharacterized protein n=1 Tax=Streptomyces cirratus TaxID=68187 RepID=A0ABQ3EWU1_9ACTN|nr:hypothetical protein [Streptomyces cirratus]GHB51333.1 hypothetical protein GCM10010347_21380 [Streptomyces cirratus]